jgi:hypothetical protein
LTTVQTGEVARELARATSRLFEILGFWAGQADRSDIAVSLATASRHMGWHADDLAGLEPDSVLLATETEPDDGSDADGEPPAPLDAALDAIRATPGSIERLAIAHRVLLGRLAAGCVAVERMTASHADAPLARVIGFIQSDLRRDRDEGEALIERLLSDVAAVERVGAAVTDAERRLVAAGGLLPVTLEV